MQTNKYSFRVLVQFRLFDFVDQVFITLSMFTDRFGTFVLECNCQIFLQKVF